MLRIGTNRTRRLIYHLIIPIVLFALFLTLDLLTKRHFESVKTGNGIKGVFSFYYIMNKGAAFSFLANKSWGQLFFKIVTPIAFVLFCLFYYYCYKKNYGFAIYGITLMVTGTLGNYIDRLIFSDVRDFIKLEFMNFAIFNLADVCLCVGVAMLVVHFLFLDKNAVFVKNEEKTKDSD